MARILWLAALLALSGGVIASSAELEGEPTLDILSIPETWLAEASPFYLDLESLLNLELTFHDLTITTDLAMGVSGIEHYATTISTMVGPLDVIDEFVFAVPYVDCYYYHPSQEFPNGLSCTSIGGLMFVKKRVNLATSIGGFSIKAMASSLPTPGTSGSARSLRGESSRQSPGPAMQASGEESGGRRHWSR
jgi:hypothetical protein